MTCGSALKFTGAFAVGAGKWKIRLHAIDLTIIFIENDVHMSPADGWIIVNHDDRRVADWQTGTDIF